MLIKSNRTDKSIYSSRPLNRNARHALDNTKLLTPRWLRVNLKLRYFLIYMQHSYHAIFIKITFHVMCFGRFFLRSLVHLLLAIFIFYNLFACSLISFDVSVADYDALQIARREDEKKCNDGNVKAHIGNFRSAFTHAHTSLSQLFNEFSVFIVTLDIMIIAHRYRKTFIQLIQMPWMHSLVMHFFLSRFFVDFAGVVVLKQSHTLHGNSVKMYFSEMKREKLAKERARLRCLTVCTMGNNHTCTRLAMEKDAINLRLFRQFSSFSFFCKISSRDPFHLAQRFISQPSSMECVVYSMRSRFVLCCERCCVKHKANAKAALHLFLCTRKRVMS